MAYWPPLRGITDPIPIRRFDGVYKPDDEGFNLPDTLFTELINFCPDEWPAITTRPGYTVIGAFGSAVLGLGAWKGNELHAVFNDGSWRKWNDSTWTSLASGLSTTAEWSFCNFKGNLSDINLIGSNGTDAIKRYDGSTVQDLANAPAGGNYIDTQSNRLYCAVSNEIRFSALAKPTDWTTVDDAGSIPYDTSDGETINGLRAGNGNVTAFKSTSIAELYGKGPTSYYLDRTISPDVGATGHKAVTMYSGVLPFISRDGIFTYQGGIRPNKEYSIAVENFIRGMNASAASRCVAVSDGTYQYFGIPYGTATQNNRIIQYDPHHKAWYTWDGIAVTQMIRIGKELYFGDASGRVLRLGGTTDSGLTITATAITKPFTAASMARKSHWLKMWVTASITTGSSLSIYISSSATGEDWQLSSTMTASASVQYKQILVPLNRVANANAVRLKLVATGPVTIHEITRQLRELPMR